jgi:hypothetical protein
MAIDEQATAFLAGIGAPALSFPAEGTGYCGVVLGATTQDQTDIDTGEVLTFADGHPRTQLVVSLQTGLRNPGDELDDGERRWFVSWAASKSLKAALRAARTDLVEGVTLAFVWESTDAPARKGINGVKRYSVRVWPADDPPSIAETGDWLESFQHVEEPF